MNLIVLELNIRSLISHQQDLRAMLGNLQNKNSTVDIILLCETFLNSRTEKLVSIPGYDLISSNRQTTKGGGTTILIQNGLSCKRRNNLEIFQEKKLETPCVKIRTKSNKGIVVGSLYKPPNTNKTVLCQHAREVISKIRAEAGNKEISLGMDNNLDLLKACSHQQTQCFLDIILDNGLLPSITRLTRITQQSATLIDNIFISKILQHNFDSAVIINDISDHLPIITMMK